jgi:hypothetical protein
MTPSLRTQEIAIILARVTAALTDEARKDGAFLTAKSFEDRVRDILQGELQRHGHRIKDFSPQDFPDIVVDNWGVEVKHTREDRWRSVGNSVFEGHRGQEVDRVFLVFAKMGGVPEVKWAPYEDSIVHVRTSHRPRYEVEIDTTVHLFDQMGVTYADFRRLSEIDKMRHIREYARSRLGPGEHLWWLGDDPENPHTLPLAPELYTKLDRKKKRQLRAEATFLCPEIVGSGRSKTKYNEVALYLLTYRGVLASQARDMFSAGSVADPGNKQRGGNYIRRAILLLEEEIIQAAEELDSKLIEEYWGFAPPQDLKGRLISWLKQADRHATGWTPSAELFKHLRLSSKLNRKRKRL